MIIETSSYNDVVIERLVADIQALKNRKIVKMLPTFGPHFGRLFGTLVFEIFLGSLVFWALETRAMIH